MNVTEQQKSIKNLLQLVKENPDLEILPQVENNIAQDDNYSWWMAAWGDASVDEYYSDNDDERCYIKSLDFEELVDKFIDNEPNDAEDLETLEYMAEKTVNKYPWVKAILIRIKAM